MRTILFTLALVAGASALPVKTKMNMTQMTAETKECVGGKWHHTKYDALGADSSNFVDLDTMKHLKAVTCDVDHSKLRLSFTTDVYAAEWLVKFNDFTDHYLIGGDKWNCSQVDATRVGLILRVVVGAGLSHGNNIEVKTADAAYDQIFDNADIAFSSSGSCSAEDAGLGKGADKEVCIGWNTACPNSMSKGSIGLFSNKYATLDCSDCFVDFNADVFISVSIRGFSMQNISAGFRNMAINGSMVLGALSQSNWNTGVDKTLNLIPSTNLINFKVGVVPFLIYFELPVEVTASALFKSTANVHLGAGMNIDLGDAYVAWDPVKHWHHATPSPKLSFSPVLKTDANLDAEAKITITPTLTAHFDKILKYTMQATPTLDLTVTGSEADKQVCAKSTYDVTVTSETELNINIPWANIKEDKKWDTTVYESGTQNIEDKCIPL